LARRPSTTRESRRSARKARATKARAVVRERLADGRRRIADGREAGREAIARARRSVGRRKAPAPPPASPHLSLLRSPALPMPTEAMSREIRVATYNVHRWTGLNGRRAPDPARAAFVISELDADVVALQEVLRPFTGEDPLELLSDALGLHLAFAVTRQHRRGQLGNAILSRFPIEGLSVLDISHSRIERRGALCAQFSAVVEPSGDGNGGGSERIAVIATHLSLVDRTRHRQVQSLLEHPQLATGATVLLGDMNAWRRCKASRELDESLEQHHNRAWPATFPSPRPVLALDRVYARGASVVEVEAHDSAAARRASDHLPVVARVALEGKAD
jgi:endonuclease/exonuclease/phosphatase family metal-dependent hydrolase